MEATQQTTRKECKADIYTAAKYQSSQMNVGEAQPLTADFHHRKYAPCKKAKTRSSQILTQIGPSARKKVLDTEHTTLLLDAREGIILDGLTARRRAGGKIQDRTLELVTVRLEDQEIISARGSLGSRAPNSVPEPELVLAVAREGLVVLQLPEIAERESGHADAVGPVGRLELRLGLADLGSEALNLGREVLDDVLIGGALELALVMGSDSGGGEAPLVFELHVSCILHVEGDELGFDDAQLELESRDSGCVGVDFGLHCLQALLVDQIGGPGAVFGSLGVGALQGGDGARNLHVFL